MDESITKMFYPTVQKEVRKVFENARQYMKPVCRVCRVCTGENCTLVLSDRAGTAARNYQQLQKVRVLYDTIYDGGDSTEIDSSIELFGHKLRAPVMSAPFGHVSDFNPGTHFKDDYDFTHALLDGTEAAGIAGWTPDTLGEQYFTLPLKVVKEHHGFGIPAIKAWTPEEIQRKIRMCDEAGVMAIGHDIDCVGLPYLSVNGIGKVYPKSAQQLREIFSITKTPFILKGILSVQGAIKAMEAGASGIVVSNHSGNSLDQGMSSVEVLPEIKRVVGNKMTIFVDGGVRHGEDVFKMLALGADCVLIGRPYIIAAEGGEARGVALYSQKIIWELQNAMRMSGCRTLKDITRDKVIVTKD